MHPLRESFVLLPGVGATTERKLWAKGIHDWDALRVSLPLLFEKQRGDLLLGILDECERAFQTQDLNYFQKCLPRDSLWRLIPGRLDQIAYLDIESTGTGMPPAAHSTAITFYFRGQVLQEHDPRLKHLLVKKMEQEASMYCTFYGEVFDLPFLRKEFGFALDKPHLDLCFWLKRLGHKGGLKRVQLMFPEIPVRHSMDINGYDAVRLWRLHGRGFAGALETLLAYNAEDTVVLEALLIIAYNLEIAQQERLTGVRHESLAPRKFAKIPTEVSADIYRLLRAHDAPSPESSETPALV